MSVDSVLDSAFTTLLLKAQRPNILPALRPASANFQFPGGGVPPVPANLDPMIVEIPFPCRIVWAHTYAVGNNGVNVLVTTAVVELRLTRYENWGYTLPLYGDGATPSLAGQSQSSNSLTGWVLDLMTGDVIIGYLKTYSGAATCVTTHLQLRPTDVPLRPDVAVLSGDGIVTSTGDSIVGL